jgi:hypothetical protein
MYRVLQVGIKIYHVVQEVVTFNFTKLHFLLGTRCCTDSVYCCPGVVVEQHGICQGWLVSLSHL